MRLKGLDNAGAQYGLMMAGLYFAAQIASPRYGLAVLFGVLAVHLGWGGAICWRRAGLRLAATAMWLGAASLGVFAGNAAAGRGVLHLSTASALFFAASFTAGALCMLAEPHVHAREWAEWSRYMEGKSGWDVLLGRHIPDLRHNTTGRVS